MANYLHKSLSLFFLFLFVLELCACGQQGQPLTALANGNDKPSGSSTTPEPGNDGKPAPRSAGHTQSMVAANGIVYVGSDKGTLYALKASDGAVLWQQSPGSPVTTSAVVNGTVYASTHSAVYAFGAITGAARWKYAISTFISAVVVSAVNNEVLVESAVTPGSDGNGPYSIYVLRLTDGSQLWHATLTSITPGMLGVVDGNVYALDMSGPISHPVEHILALQSDTGHELWRVSIESIDGLVRRAPLALNELVYFTTTSGAVYALRATTGHLLWHAARPGTKEALAGDALPPALVNGVLYVNAEQGTYALRATDGTVLWEKNGIFFPLPFIIQPVVSDGHIYVAANGSIQALRMQDGSQIWQSSSFSINGPLTIEDGLIYIDSPDKISALHEQDGSLAWQQPVDHHSSFSNASTSMLLAGGVVYASEDSGVIQALSASDGKPLWSYTIQEQAVLTDLVYDASITFASSMSYQQALKIIASLGLQLSAFCPSMWQPQVNSSIFSNHVLFVAATVNSAPLWMKRLQAIAGVENVQAAGPHSCPMERVDDAFLRLHLQQSDTFVQVTFSPAVSYDNALEAVSNLWFRMADPCYEQARAQGTKPEWSSQGQVATFAKTHSFILATTTLNSIHWLDQLHALAGVVEVDASLKMKC